MPCFVEEIEFCGKKETALFCSMDDHAPPEPCATCKAPGAPYLCDWPALKLTPVKAADLSAGEEVIFSWYAARRAKITTIESADVAHHLLITYEWRSKSNPGRRHVAQACVSKTSTVQAMRPGTCDAPCCELHSREVADEVHYCADHWTDWELVT